MFEHSTTTDSSPMKLQTIIYELCQAAAGAAALCLLSSCATTDGISGGGTPHPATKEAPFVNSLGMKFVPVPGTNILMCTTETTVAQYRMAGRGYNAPWFPQGDNHPAVNVTWADAKAWCAWLSAKEGRRYRLPTAPEWGAAAGPGPYPWGAGWPPPGGAGNYCGQEWRNAPQQDKDKLKEVWTSKYGAQKDILRGFEDPYLYTAPVESGPPNALGLKYMSGNAWEWCESKVLRGASWADNAKEAVNLQCQVSSYLYDFDNGFRCVLAN